MQLHFRNDDDDADGNEGCRGFRLLDAVIDFYVDAAVQPDDVMLHYQLDVDVVLLFILDVGPFAVLILEVTIVLDVFVDVFFFPSVVLLIDDDHVDAMCISMFEGHLSLYDVYVFGVVDRLAIFRLADATI